MNWLVFSYSLPSKGPSSLRVSLWRRLQRQGSVSITNGTYLLPDLPETLEAFHWLAEEVRQAGGETLLMRVGAFEGLGDADIVARFRDARREDYHALLGELEPLELALDDPDLDTRRSALEALEKLRKRHADIRRIDYFETPDAADLLARLTRLGERLAGEDPPAERVDARDPDAFRDRSWVTRPQPHVDRLACAWLIRRFIDPGATIHYRDELRRGEVGFDMPGGDFSHVGALCTFEVMLRAFALHDSALTGIAEVVHDLDLDDARYGRPETAGVGAVLDGWRRLELSDEEREARGAALFEGLYAAAGEPPVSGRGA